MHRDRVQFVSVPGSADEPQKSPRVGLSPNSSALSWIAPRSGDGLVEAELDPAGRAMAVNSPQPWSLIGLTTSIPSAWRAATVAATSSQSRYSSARPPSSAGWTASSAGGRAKIS
jgi:hypothetical protein